MKVYVLFDIEKEIVAIYNTKQQAMEEASCVSNRYFKEYEVIEKDTQLKSINTVYEKVYDPKGMNDTMPFGKYKDQNIGDLIEKDPSYIAWCKDNLNFNLDEECQEFLQEMLNKGK